ncbi:uncharacterized protein LOC128265978 [Drosophila gunungcola]|uniref:uncharacterized protein LOC128265978 n=1 Tax=Drosophila gunungcola TaxID=103775 RepID=UPI0022E76953|nr:uncharacterized protein LOC128265978 [Drosophila gunungcola]
MTRAFSTSENDYVTIKELMERRQGYNESLEDYISAMHNLQFKLRNKIPESNLVEILKENLNSQMGAFLLASSISTLAELKREGIRVEKWLKDKRSRPRHVNEIINESEKGYEADDYQVEAFQNNRPPKGAGMSDRRAGEDRSEKRHAETIKEATSSPAQISSHKTWYQRKAEYEEARARIFNTAQEEEDERSNRNNKKLRHLHQTLETARELKRKLVASIISLKNDNRLFGKTKVDGEEIVALLDTGASANCIGKGAELFLQRRQHKMQRLTRQNVQTASGGKTQVTGIITLPVEWEGETKELEFLIVPALQQHFYFGIEFWEEFKLPLPGKRLLEVAQLDTVAPEEENPERPETAYTPHKLTEQQENTLKKVVYTFPSCTDMGLGKTELEEHVIEVTQENLPIKQRHYPISPAKQKLMRRFLGMTGWYRRFIQNYAQMAEPLHESLKKDRVRKYELEEEGIKAFEALKTSLVSAPVLTTPDFSKPFTIQCDASTTGVGGVLFQTDEEGGEHPIAYISSKLDKAQRNYSITELECLAAILSIRKFRPYVEGMPFKVITDHASLKWLMGQKDLSGRLARWSLKLQAFDFEIEHRKGSQNVVPDALSRVHMDEVTAVLRDAAEINIDLQSAAFQSKEYKELAQAVEKHAEKTPDTQTSEGYVYKRVGFRTGEIINEDRAWKLWVPEELRQDVVHHAQHSQMAGHGGIHKTLARLRQLYYWPAMTVDVQRTVKNCEILQSQQNNEQIQPTANGKTTNN